jgi:asparagine synthase (glutamine-hydrolysing)
MCGICGIINFNAKAVASSSIERMMVAMKHRGPDDEGWYLDENHGFGHVRLSIIDLSKAGHQPMFSDDKRFMIVYNGEIYNYIELRKELEYKYKFRTNTDTEVIINAFREWGQDCLNHFNGMFAFAFYDIIKKQIFIARDRFGIKPLYYFQNHETFVFASDIPPILTYIKDIQPDDQSIYDYLVFNRTNHNDKTFFKGIKRLMHGCKIQIQGTSLKLINWYCLKDNLKASFTSVEEFREAFNKSITLQLRSDVPVGTCLSGGLDSSSIVSCISKFHNQPEMNTFSAIYGKDQKGDESEFISEYNGIVKKMHFVRPTAESLGNDLNEFVDSLVEPLPGTSEYAEFKVMQIAKEHVTVLLNGQGADEQMAGYLYFAGYYYRELFRKLKFYRLLKEMYLDKRNHKKWEGPLSFIFFSLPPFVKDKFGKAASSFLNKEFSQRHSISDEIVSILYSSKTLSQSFIDHFEHKFEHHLSWADRSGMYFSLETRFPFLDHNLVERLLSTPSVLVIKDGWNKYILRESMKGILPDKI